MGENIVRLDIVCLDHAITLSPPAARWLYTCLYRAHATLISSTVICTFRILQSSTTAPLSSIRPHLSRMHRRSHRPHTTPTSPHRRLAPYVITLSHLLRHLPTWLSFPLRLHHYNLAEPCHHLFQPRILWSCRRSHRARAMPLPHSLSFAPYGLVVVHPDHLSFPPPQPDHHACATLTLRTAVRQTSLSMVASSSPLPTWISSVNEMRWHIKC
jgi:hypothetical protein